MKKSVKIILIALCVVLICVAAFSGYKIISTLSAYKQAEQTYDDLSAQVVTVVPSPTPVPEQEKKPDADPEVSPLQVDFAALRAQSTDYVAYIYSPDTKINYPVMQTFDDPSTPDEDESQYYIKRGIEKQCLKRGSLFMDYRSVAGEGYLQDNYFGGIGPSNIIMIYGHNMADGEMFGYLYYYMNTDYAMEHRYIEFDTLFERRVYEVVSAFRSHVFTVEDYMDYSKYNDPNFKYYQFCGDLTEDRFVYWYSNVMSHNENDLPEYNASYDDEFLVLSTCSGTDETGAKNEDGRLCVVAVRIE